MNQEILNFSQMHAEPAWLSDLRQKAALEFENLELPNIGEIIGGSQREESFEKLNKRMDELKMNKNELSWYLDLRKYGTCVHSGFGLGFERVIMYLTGMENIRDVIPFPRTPGSCEY